MRKAPSYKTRIVSLPVSGLKLTLETRDLLTSIIEDAADYPEAELYINADGELCVYVRKWGVRS